MKNIILLGLIFSMQANAQVSAVVSSATWGSSYIVAKVLLKDKFGKLKDELNLFTSAPIYLSIGMTALSPGEIELSEYKKEIMAIQEDASNFIAGFEPSDSLQTFIDGMRIHNPELERFSDLEIAAALLQLK